MEGRRIISLDAGDVAHALASIPLFDGLPDREIVEIAGNAHLLAFSDGDVIVPEGEEGLGFYVLLSGEARVVRGGREVACLRPPGFFGEIALIERTPRTASVIAVGPTTCVGILRSLFRPVLARNPRLALRILDEEARRLQESAVEPAGD